MRPYFRFSIVLLIMLCVPVVEATVKKHFKIYGTFKGSLLHEDEAGSGPSTQFVNNNSRMGMKGEESYQELTGFYNFQVGMDNDGNSDRSFSPRFFYAGVKNKYGTLKFGRASIPYRRYTVKLDPFYDTAAGVDNGASNYGLSLLTRSWSSNTVLYESPIFFKGLQIEGAVVFDDSEKDQNDFNLALQYQKSEFLVRTSYLKTKAGTAGNSTNNSDYLQIMFAYDSSVWDWWISYELHNEKRAVTGIDDSEPRYLYTALSYRFNPAWRASASIGQVGSDQTSSSAQDQGVGYALGIFYRALPHVEFSLVSSSVEKEEINGFKDGRSVVALGAVYSFGIEKENE